jgi:hypothetical protein
MGGGEIFVLRGPDAWLGGSCSFLLLYHTCCEHSLFTVYIKSFQTSNFSCSEPNANEPKELSSITLGSANKKFDV